MAKVLSEGTETFETDFWKDANLRKSWDDIVPGEPPVAIARRAVQTAALEGYDAVLLDTAGRLAIDEDARLGPMLV